MALELIDAASSPQPDPEPYLVSVATHADRVVGYACYGITPLTGGGVYDLYWIAVDPTLQGGGVGRLLMAHVEREVKAAGGRKVLVETASKPSYAATRAFYERIGYVEEARLRDFYAEGDDKLIYSRRV